MGDGSGPCEFLLTEVAVMGRTAASMDNELTVFDTRKDWMPSDDCTDIEGHEPQ